MGQKVMKQITALSDKSGIRELSCVRQFYNLKRIYKKFVIDEEEEFEMGIVSGLEQWYLLSEAMAYKYSRIVFMSRWRMEAKKKKLGYLLQEDLEASAAIIMKCWGIPDTLNINQELLEGFREFKTIIFGNRIQDQLKAHFLGQIKPLKVTVKIITLLKALSTIGLKISKNMDFKDLFGMCHEDIVGWMGKLSYSPEQWRLIYDKLGNAPDGAVKPERLSSDEWNCFREHWKVFVEALGSISLLMHERSTAVHSSRRWFPSALVK